ncbi:MAG: hypothetical protein ACP5N7_00985 [Candidatus Pacearchaeota archaeon]
MTTPKHVKARVALNPKLNPNGKGGGSVAKYKKEYCQMLVDHMAKGYSFGSFGADVNCGRRTLNDWVDRYEEFKAAREEGQEKAKKYFETLANLKMRGEATKNFDPKRADTALIIFFLKTRFKEDYSEKLEHEITSSAITINYKEKDAAN